MRVRIVGKCVRLESKDVNDATVYGLREYLVSLLVENENPLLSQYMMFRKHDKLTAIADDLFENMVNTTSFVWSFYGCDKLSHVSPTLFQTCAKVDNFGYTFYYCESLNRASVNLWKTTYYQGLFSVCKSLKEVHFWNLPNDTDKVAAFIEQLPDRTNWTGKDTPTLYIRKNIPEARDTLTEEQEAALNARGWVLGTEEAES